jgi:beta-lactamase superfamily II metal-dependent hydrolase
MRFYGNNIVRWSLPIVIFILALVLTAPEVRPWSGDSWGPLTRGEIVERAEEMINLTWSPNRGIYNYRSSVGYTVYNSYITYTGQAYSQNNPQENRAEFVSQVNNVDFTTGATVRVVASSLNMRDNYGTGTVIATLSSGTTGTILVNANNGIKSGDYYWYYLSASGKEGWCAAYSDSIDYLVRNQTGYGNDCSGFASICWRLPSRYTTWTFEHDASNAGGYVDSLGAAGTGQTAGLIRGDALNDDYNHIVLFNRDLGGGQMEAMEQTPTTARVRTWYWSSLASYRPIRRRDLTITPPPTPVGGTPTPIPPETPTPVPPRTPTPIPPPPTPVKTPVPVPTPIASPPPGTDVVLNEIMPNPHTDYWSPYGYWSTADGENEYIELYNAGPVPVDISGWRLKRNGSLFATIDSNPATAAVPSGGHILLVTDDTYANQGNTNITGYRSSFAGSFSLNQTGGYTISLHDGTDGEQDSVTLPEPSGGYGDDRPYYRSPDGGSWIYASSSSERSPTGYLSSFVVPTPVPTPVPSGAILNEIMPKPGADYYTTDGSGGISDEQNEYIEIYNIGPGSIDISGWKIKKDGSGTLTIDKTSETTNVPPGGHILLVRDDTYAEQGGPNITGFRSGYTGTWENLNIDEVHIISLHDGGGGLRDSVLLQLPPSGSFASDHPYYRSPDGGTWRYADESSEKSPRGYGPTATPTTTATPVPVPTAVITPPPVTDSLRNPGFEESPDLVYWNRVGTAASVSRSSGVKHSGSYSCRLDNPTSSYSGRGIASSPVTVIPGRDYNLSGYFFLAESGGDAGSTLFRFRVQWMDSNQYLISSSPGSTGWSLDSFNTWEKLEFSGNTAPGNAAFANLLIECRESVNNDNDAYLDDFSFVLSGVTSPIPTMTPAVPPEPSPTPAPNLEIYCIEVGLDASDYGFFHQGDSTLIISPDGTTMLIDGGAAGNSGANSVLALLERVIPDGVLDYIVTTHWDGDHSLGLEDIATYNSGQYLPSAVYDLGDSGGPSYDAAFTGIRSTPAVGDEIDLGGGCTALVVSVDGYIYGEGYVDPKDDKNARSIGFLIRYGGFDYLTLGDLTGDLPDPIGYHPDVEGPLAESLADAGYSIDVLHVSHHGSAYSTYNEFVAELLPEYAVISCGNNNGYGHPNQSAINRLNGLTWNGNPYSPAYDPVRTIYTLERGDSDAGEADNVRIVGNGSSYNAYQQGSLRITAGGGGSWYSFADEGPLPPGADVVINQVCPFSSPGEFVELYNSGNFPVSLDGWRLDVYSGDYTFSSSDIIPPRGYYLISDTDPVNGVLPDLTASINITDNGSGSFARIIDSSSMIVDTIGWKTSALFEGSRLGTLGSGKAWKRTAAGVDTDENSVDFSEVSPDPRNSSIRGSSILASGDYDGDGSDDIAVFRSASGLWAVRGVTRVYFGGFSDIPVPGDYDGDGRSDIGIFRSISGLWAVRGVTRAYFGSSSDTAIPGDYDGDSRCDIGIFRPASGLWAIRGVTRVYFGGSTDEPVPGYFDADGSKDIGIFRGSSGLWAIRGVTRVYFGGSTDKVVPGDYNGDGLWEEGIFRGSSGLWAIRGVTRSYFGSGSDLPVPADYTGRGADSIGIFRGSSGLWAVNGVTRVYFGSTIDIPVTR